MDEWTFEPEDYRKAAAKLEQAGVKVPRGTLTQDTIDAMLEAASREVGTALRVALLAFHIGLEQLARARAEASMWADNTSTNAARIVVLEAERSKAAGDFNAIIQEHSARIRTVEAQRDHARLWARWWQGAYRAWRADAANLAHTPLPALPRATARDIILAAGPNWFWSLRLPFLFLLWIYGPDMAAGWGAGWREGRAAAEASERRLRVRSHMRWNSPTSPKLEA